MAIYIEREGKEGKKSPFFLPPIVPPPKILFAFTIKFMIVTITFTAHFHLHNRYQ